jgi:Flp pilus assembly protein TadD
VRLINAATLIALLADCAGGGRAPAPGDPPRPWAPPAPGAPAAATASPAAQALPQAPTQAQPYDSIRELTGRLDLEWYKATIRGLTQFGDRRQGTERNRAAVDWIEAQFKSYGCTNTERIHYEFTGRQIRPPGDTTPPRPRPAAARPALPRKGFRGPTGVNTNPELQPDTVLRRINAEPDTPGPREEVFCTKVGTTHPEEMYIIGAHMDGHGYGAAANDDGSGTALVMELARVLSMPDVTTERSVRFALWNNEETGLNGARAYVEQRKDLQGKEDPPGSGRYPEPRWLGMIQHDMMLFDHGMPGPDGKVSPTQRREADVNIEFAGASKMAAEAGKLAWLFRAANDRYATDYPAAVGDRMSNTDSGPFQDLVAAISLRENERLAQIGSGWDPQWHQPTDVFGTYSDADFRLGLNAAQTTLAAVAELAGAALRRAGQSGAGAGGAVNGGGGPDQQSDALREASRLDSEGKTAEARVIFQRLIDRAPDPAAKAAAQRAMAMSYAFDGDCADAVKYEEMVIAYWVTREAAEPQNAFFQEGETANEAARVCIDAGDLDAAEKYYRRGSELGLKEPEPRTHAKSLWDFRLAHALGRLAARRGDQAEAARRVAEARKLLDGDSTLAVQQERFYPYLTGYVALYTGDLRTAETELTRAIGLRGNQNDPFMHCLLAMTYEKLGQAEKAKALYRQAYDLATGHNPPAAFVRPFARKKLAVEGPGA